MTRLGGLLNVLDAKAPRPESFPDQPRGRWLTARVGSWLGVCVTVCFITGMWSHVSQHPPWWFDPPSRPRWGYAVSQGLHVTSGLAAIPLLAIKLWSVAPQFWKRPMVSGPRHAIQRASVGLLVAASIFELVTGLLNIAQAYVFPFFFPAVHFAIAWLMIGAMLIHIGAQWPAIVAGLRERQTWKLRQQGSGVLTRRGVLTVGFLGAGIAVVTSVGDKIPLFSRVSVFSQRDRTGPQGVPVNGLAAGAGIVMEGRAEAWRLTVAGPEGTRVLTLEQVRRLPQTTVHLPIACVEGWNVMAQWKGPAISEVAALVGGGSRASVSASPDKGLYGRSEVGSDALSNPATLLALELNGEPLHIDHGFPARLIAPNRPGALQTKWIDHIEVFQ